MAKHEVILHENTGATQASAPYLGTYVSKGKTDMAAFAPTVAAQCGLPEIQLQAILTGCIDAIQELERESLVRVNLDGGTICGSILGSFPTADAAFDPVRNKLVLAFHPDSEVCYALADITPTIVTAETVTKVRVDNVMDVETPRPYEVIHGKHVFDIFGLKLNMSDTGAGVEMTDQAGVTYPCTVVQAVSEQHVKARTTNLLEGGDYKVVVKSRGGDAEGPLQSVFRKVKYLKIVDPTRITDVTSETGEPNRVTMFEDMVVTGENLTPLASDTIKCWKEGLEFERPYLDMVEDLTPTSFKVKAAWWQETDEGSGDIRITVNGVAHTFMYQVP